MKKEKIDIVFLLDRSGSMSGSEEDTIGGYNGYIDSLKNKDAYVTTILFDDKYEVLNDRVSIKEVKKLTKKTYYVRGCTALMDAIGKTINSIDGRVNNKVMFIITTDGLENASKEYNKENVKSLIEKHKNWEFIYIGAGIDSYSEGASIGISSKNISNYKKNKKGMSLVFSSLSRATDMYECEDAIGASWKDELESYINNNTK